MREHPIPQDVVGYRFHIIGNMTLKQFAEVGAGCIVGFLIYTTNLPGLIKWPLISIAVGMGALAAFVPFEERPLDHWIMTFFKVLYRPTKFFWKREPHIPDAFTFEPNLDNSNLTAELDLSPYRRQRIKEYLFSVQGSVQLDQFELDEENRLQSIMSAFNTTRGVQAGTEQTGKRPRLKVRVRQLKAQQTTTDMTVPQFSVDKVFSIDEEILPMTSAPFLARKDSLDISQVAQDVNIPELEQIEIATPFTEEEQSISSQMVAENDRAYVAPDVNQGRSSLAATESVVQNTSLPFPAPPTEPNKLVGMLLTPTNELVSDAIVEIQTADGRVARAVKSNALGQFFISTPLESGSYTILAEKEGHTFMPQSLDLVGAVVAPIEIRSV